MTLTPVYLVPGFSLVDSPYAAGQVQAYASKRVARGRWIDGDKVRFVSGFPEKLGGWSNIINSGIVGTPFALKSLRNSAAQPELVIGTSSHLYAWAGSTLTDITPQRDILTNSLSGAITTTLNSTNVQVADSSNTAVVGEWIYVSASAAVGGLTIAGWYLCTSRNSSGFDFSASSNATSSATGGGTVTVSYPRTNLTNPFTTTSGSSTVTVAHTNHGAITGNFVDFSGASAVGGLTISGEYEVTVLNANSYTITASSNATSSASGGGTVSVFYLISIQSLEFSGGLAFGTGVFGSGQYGIGTASVPDLFGGWSLSPYGNIMACCPVGGTIYFYNSVSGGRAYPLLNAPTNVLSMFVTPERFIVALGLTTSTLEYLWCDQTDPTNWTTTVTDTANSGTTLQGGSYFMGGVVIGDGISLIFTDRCVFIMEYNGTFTVYTVQILADNAGLIGPHAGTAEGSVAYWMSDKDFWTYNGSVSRIPSDEIHDYVFRNLNNSYKSLCHVGLNRIKREVWFFYPSTNSVVCDSYVIYHIDQQCWSIGTMDRSAWTDAELFLYPIGASNEGVIYYHENGVDADGQPMTSYLQSSLMDTESGNVDTDVFGMVVDFERLVGDIQIVVYTARYPQDTLTSSQIYTISDDDAEPRIDMREAGKLFSFSMQSSELGGDFRLSSPRIDIQPAGSRL